jgi:inosine/xanthosine triphosphate pyrophosphatase family protein
MHFAESQGILYQVRSLTTTDCSLIKAQSHDWIQMGNIDGNSLIVHEEELIASKPSSLALSLCLFHDEYPAALVLATFRRATNDYPAEGIYAKVIAQKGLPLPHASIDLVLFARDLYFTQIPWLLSVLVEVPHESRICAELEDHEFQFCGAAGPRDERVLLFESERTRWLRQHRNLTAQDTNVDFLPAFSALLGKPPSGAPIVFFRTGSPEKRIQYRYLFRCFGIDVQDVKHSVSLIEPQVEGHGPEPESALVHEPLKLFSRFAAREESYPFVVEDTMLFIEHFNADFERRPMLPGPDTKRWWNGLGADGILRAMGGSKLRQALYVCQLGIHIGPGEYEHFRAEVRGSVATSQRKSRLAEQLFPYSNSTFFHSIFIPDGTSRTLAEMDPSEFRPYDYRRLCLASAVESLRRYGRMTGDVQLTIPLELD